METKRPFQARSVNPLHEDTSEYKNFEPSSTPSEVKYPRVNYENMSPTRQIDPKGLWPNSSPQLNRGRSKPYRIPSRSSRDPEDRRVYEDRFRHRPDREPPRTERPSSSNSGYSFDPSYYDHNSCAGADSKKYGRNNSPSTPFTTRSSQRDKSNDPVSIDNARGLNSGEFLTHNEASEFAPMDTTFSRIGDKERRPRENDGFAHSRGRGYRANSFDRIKRYDSERESGKGSYRNYRSIRDHSSRGIDSFSNYQDRDWMRERNRDRGRWERDRDISRDYGRVRGYDRWDSERMYEKPRESDIRFSRFEPNDSYRARDRNRGYFGEDPYRREFYGDFRREPTDRSGHEYYSHSRNSLTPERRSESAESTRYSERYQALGEGSLRDEDSLRNGKPYEEFDNNEYFPYTRKNSTSIERPFSSVQRPQEEIPEKPGHDSINNEKSVALETSAPKLHPREEGTGSGKDDGSQSPLKNLKSSPLKQIEAQKSDELMETSDSVEVSINIQSGDTLIPYDGNSIDLLEKTADPSSTNQHTMATTAQIPCTNTKKQKTSQSDSEDVSSMDLENTTGVSCIASGPRESSLQGASHAFLSQMDEHALEISHQDLEKSLTSIQTENDDTRVGSCEDPSDVTSNNSEDLRITHELKGPRTTHETTVKVEEQDGFHIDQQETDVKEVTLAEEKTSLTQDKIFTLIDHIDSEIGRYEALLVNVRKNKKSCIEAESLERENSLDSSNRVEVKTKVIQLLKPDFEAKRSANSDLAVSQTALGSSSDLLKCKERANQSLCPNPPKPLLYQQIYAENRSLAKSNINPFPGPIYKSLEDYPFYSKNIEKHKKIRGLIFTHLRHKSNSLEEKETRLRQEYKEHLDSWRIRVIKLDKRREKKRSRKHMEDELLVSNASVRAQRRGGSYNTDAVRSEAELMEIIQYLENEDLRNPDVRSMRTAAKIPSMILDPSKRELTQYDNRNNLIEDPFNYYHCNSSVDEWTNEEREIFIKRYLQYPKQFGKIASFFKNKNPRQCVLFYYREKKSIDFKRLISGKEKKKRRLTRKGAGKRTGKRKKSKGSSLVEDIEEAERTFAPDESTGSQSFSDGRMSKESDSVPASPEAQKCPKKSRGKYRHNTLPDDEGEINDIPPQHPVTTARWSEEDRRIALEAYKRFGQDFCSVSKAVGSKTDEQCRNFYYNFRRKYGMSALEAPLDMANEKGTDLKSSLSNDSFQPGRTGRKQATSVESKTKRRQAKLKRKNPDKPLFEGYHDKNSSMEEISVQNTYATTNRHSLPIESTIKPENLNDKSLLPEQLDTSCSVESVINQKDNMYSDKSDNPLNLIPLAISTCPSHFMDRPSSYSAAPQENFLELLVQAAFSQEANTPASIRKNQSPPNSSHSKHLILEPSLPVTPDLTKSDSGDNSENVAHPAPTFTSEEKRTYTYNHPVKQPSVNLPLLHSEGRGLIEAENTYHSNLYVNDTSKTVIPMVTTESIVQFDPTDAQVMEETITYGVAGAPGTLSPIHTISQGVNQEPPSQVNLHYKDAPDISSPVNVRAEYAGTDNSPSIDWHVRDTGYSASSALNFSKDTTPEALHSQAKETLTKPSNPSRHTWQGDNVFNCYQMPHKLPDQKPQPIQQLQLLQLQPLSTDVAQISP